MTVAGAALLSSLTGAVLDASGGAVTLLTVMLLSALPSLAAAMHVRVLDRRIHHRQRGEKCTEAAWREKRQDR